MRLATLGLLLGLAFAQDFDVNKCENMFDEECRRVAKDVFNYTVPEIRRMTTVMRKIQEQRIACKIADVCPTPRPALAGNPIACTGGSVSIPGGATYSCSNIDLLAFVPLAQLGSSSNADGNDIWGWTDEEDPLGGERRYAITGQTDGSSIVDVTDPVNPEVLCFIPSRVGTLTTWRDIKIVENDNGDQFAAIVADRSGQGLQWVPLRNAITKCRNSGTRPYRLQEGLDFGWTSGTYTGGSNTHNIVGSDNNKPDGTPRPTGRVYLVGSNSCSGGLIPVDFSEVSATGFANQPQRAGCYSSDGYSHDAECWTYHGPDTRYTGQEICVGYNENSITIVDYTNPNSPQQLSRTTYSGSRYTHQGWRTVDERWLLMNDELDESSRTVPSQTTYVLNIESLTNPTLVRWYSGVNSIDHNLYIRRFGNTDYSFQSNYRAGLRVLSFNPNFGNNADNALSVAGEFKTWTGSLSASFNGAWSSFPYFSDEAYPGLVVVQDIEQGLFILDACKALNNCVQSKKLNQTEKINLAQRLKA